MPNTQSLLLAASRNNRLPLIHILSASSTPLATLCRVLSRKPVIPQLAAIACFIALAMAMVIQARRLKANDRDLSKRHNQVVWLARTFYTLLASTAMLNSVVQLNFFGILIVVRTLLFCLARFIMAAMPPQDDFVMPEANRPSSGPPGVRRPRRLAFFMVGNRMYVVVPQQANARNDILRSGRINDSSNNLINTNVEDRS
jgi:hypothetical protein